MTFASLLKRYGQWDFARRAKASAPAAASHALFFCGLGAISVGAWMAWHPAGPIVGGLFAVWTSFLISAESKR